MRAARGECIRQQTWTRQPSRTSHACAMESNFPSSEWLQVAEGFQPHGAPSPTDGSVYYFFFLPCAINLLEKRARW